MGIVGVYLGGYYNNLNSLCPPIFLVIVNSRFFFLFLFVKLPVFKHFRPTIHPNSRVVTSIKSPLLGEGDLVFICYHLLINIYLSLMLNHCDSSTLTSAKGFPDPPDDGLFWSIAESSWSWAQTSLNSLAVSELFPHSCKRHRNLSSSRMRKTQQGSFTLDTLDAGETIWGWTPILLY